MRDKRIWALAGRLLIVWCAAMVTAWLAVADSVDAIPRPAQPIRILFVGNSLTAANGLPSMVEALANARGTAVEITSVAVNNFSLEDHWNEGRVRAAIGHGHWSVVVLQQGPSSLPESRVLLRDYVRRFAAEAGKAGARTALYMVWPAKSRHQDFERVIESYVLAARDVGGLLLPAGDAWREAWQLDRSLELYAEDGFHPNRLGSYLAALVIWKGISGQPVAGLPGIGGIDHATTATLQHAAERSFVTGARRRELDAAR
jgi:hypothetical protein